VIRCYPSRSDFLGRDRPTKSTVPSTLDHIDHDMCFYILLQISSFCEISIAYRSLFLGFPLDFYSSLHVVPSLALMAPGANSMQPSRAPNPLQNSDISCAKSQTLLSYVFQEGGERGGTDTKLHP
jgi:hypothetical protein